MPDPRVERTRHHKLTDVLIIAISTLLCGVETFNDMEDFGKAKRDWFDSFLDLEGGIPSHDTFNRVFAALDPRAFLDCFLRWTQSLRRAVKQEIVALDGKALRRALNAGQSLNHVVSAWAESNNLVLGQLKVTEKSNGITAVPELLRALELAGCIVTADAIKRKEPHLTSARTADKGHGRIEIRHCWQSDQIQWFADKGLRSVGVVENLVQTRGLVINLLRQDKTSKRSIKGRLLHAAIDPDYLKSILKT